jgi:GNAT superfamily N-acetyltransferase
MRRRTDHRRGEATAEIKRMWVAERFRGLGVGATMLTRLERTAAELGYRRVVLDTNGALSEALSLYRRSGYAVTDRYNDNPYAQHWFTKSLQPVIRPFETPDTDSLAKMVVDMQRGEFGLDITLADQPDLADVQRHYRNAGGEFWVAAYGNEVVGSIGLLASDSENVVMRKMFVHADQRGSGLAAALLATAMAWSEDNGFDVVTLGTTAAMTSAHRFYERCGLARIEPADLPAGFPRMTVDSVFYTAPVTRVLAALGETART